MRSVALTNLHEEPTGAGLVGPLRTFSHGAAVCVVVLGLAVLGGWQFGVETLKRVFPDTVAMNPMTAVCFILAAGSLWLSLRMTGKGAAAGILAGIVLLVALLKLWAITGLGDAGVDRLLFRRGLDADAVMPNRMAPTTALCFALSALAMLQPRFLARRPRSGQLLALWVALIALLALVGYCYGVRRLAGFAAYIPMALHTAMGFVLLSAAILCARPDAGLMARFVAPTSGGALVRRLVAIIVAIPVLLGWLILAGQRSGGYTLEFGFSVFVVLIIVVFSILIWRSAGAIDQKERERDAAQAGLRKARDELESRVEERTADLAQVVAHLRSGIEVLATSTEEIVSSATGMAGRVGNTATAITQATSTAEEIRHTARIAGENARLVADMTKRADQASRVGRQAAKEAAAGMEDIHRQTDAVAAGMVHLSEQGRLIAQIIATVEDLAEQSNILAVNAGIEAAKAGDYGKGFSVVAAEVRSLADQSREATGQIRGILVDILKATEAAAAAAERSAHAVEAGGRQSAEAGESIGSLTANIEEAAKAVAQIAAASTQQSVGMDQLAGAMRQIEDASTGNAESARRLEEAARRLGGLGSELKALVERYRA